MELLRHSSPVDGGRDFMHHQPIRALHLEHLQEEGVEEGR
jgi:hypothetical protein